MVTQCVQQTAQWIPETNLSLTPGHITNLMVLDHYCFYIFFRKNSKTDFSFEVSRKQLKINLFINHHIQS